MSTCFALLTKAAVLRKAAGIVREISRIITLDQWRKMRHGNVLSLTKDD
jgi:hypothetical protein